MVLYLSDLTCQCHASDLAGKFGVATPVVKTRKLCHPVALQYP